MIRVPVRAVSILAALLIGACSPGPQVPEWKLVATDPAPAGRLGRQQPLYVQFEVRSAAPVSVTVMPRYRGEDQVDGLATHGKVLLPAGGGTGVTFLFFWTQTPTRVDELQFTVTAKDQPPRQFSAPVDLTWRADPQTEPEPAPWVVEWRKTQNLSAAAKRG
jgi:hypothetical protein